MEARLFARDSGDGWTRIHVELGTTRIRYPVIHSFRTGDPLGDWLLANLPTL